MSEIKVRLSLEVPGATMLSSQDCEKMSKKEACDHTVIVVEHKVRKGKKFVIEKTPLHINTRKSKPARQNISLSEEAYNYMIDVKEIPSITMTKVWNSLSPKQRLEYHLGLIAEGLRATSYSYQILN